jgi:predicted transcriptional regulator of viral defense system
MSNAKATYQYLDSYLKEVRAQGRYAFTIDELKDHFRWSPNTLNQTLYRAKQRKEIALIRPGFHVIIPSEYSKQGIIPPYLYLDDLMKSLDKPYYVGLLSAAALHGAAHQQPTRYTVITQSPAPRSVEKLGIMFFSKREFIKDGIVHKKTLAGYIDVSSPELTALDFFDYLHKFGINRIATILQELSEEMKPAALSKIAKQYPNTAAIQRLGYVLEHVAETDKLSDTIHKALGKRTIFPVPLSPQKGKKGEIDSKWKIIKNMEIETDL